ncbi:GNAT family N-acetyltransferase [Streptomyces pristinaespiralis]|uniref:GNAT family N-acetyltransferase n=1 Tax=Streptomyces pristinaespiralis TaxID=38300 RepID=UPI003838B810
MEIRTAQKDDFEGYLGLAAQVEDWFGPMVDDPGFHQAVTEHIVRSTALVAAEGPEGSELLGGLLFGPSHPAHHVHWLVISAQARGRGVGKALMADAMSRFVRSGPATVEVVTFGPDHPGAVTSGARVFYERLGFTPAEATEPGPEGGSRQIYRLTVA